MNNKKLLEMIEELMNVMAAPAPVRREAYLKASVVINQAYNEECEHEYNVDNGGMCDFCNRYPFE